MIYFALIPVIAILLPLGWSRGWREAQRALNFRIDFPDWLLPLVILITTVVFVGRLMGSGFSIEESSTGVLLCGGMMALIVVFSGPYYAGKWLAHFFYRRDWLKRAKADSGLLLLPEYQAVAADWLRRDGELLVVFRDDTPAAEEYSFLVRSVEELLHVLLQNERSRATAEVRAPGGEKLVLQHF